ncbi:MAG TPA: EscU/YscU/HrcU family type III secretion system export apparatus switch protein, partial [Isosphaeraceae bacterium]|nr:EscU/YscU/HrcU family type III secretion system export apparatus switch protein [Isosphaeraceae bacterium]
MSDERTQPPSKRRRQLARQQGQAVHSPELTAAAGWLVAVIVLGLVGENLTRGFTELVSGSLTQPGALMAEPVAVVSRVREFVV